MNPQWELTGKSGASPEAGESAVILLMVDPDSFSESQQAALNMIRSFDYRHNSSCGVIYHLAAYWKARSHHLLVSGEARSHN